MNTKTKVVLFRRKPFPFHKSLEIIFSDLAERMPPNVECVPWIFSHHSTGILNRLLIMWEAYTHQGDVNHITGDIHFSAIWLKRGKTMLTVHDCGMLSGSKGIKHAFLKYFWFSLPLKRCAAVTVISEATKKELLKYTNYPEKNIRLINVAVSEAFKYVPKPFNKRRPVILQVGTKPNKNIERLIEALKDVSCELNIIGRIPDSLRQKLEVHSIAYTNKWDLSEAELVQQYVSCDLLSFVSTYEGFGMPIVEANATGRPVITSNLLSMPEVAGDAACLVDPFNVEEIRAGLLKIIADDEYRNTLVQNGFKNQERFNPQAIASQYVELYTKLAKNGKADS